MFFFSIKFKNDSGRIIKNQRNIITQTNFLRIQLAHLQSTYRKNLEKQENIQFKEFLLEMYVKEESPMSRKANKEGVNVIVEGDDIRLRANKGILTTVFDNIFLNSLYWVQYAEQEKYIKFVIKSNGQVECFDSGCGVHVNIEDSLFEPFSYMKKRILGALFLSATLGLGLASCGGNDKVEVRFNLAYGNNLRTMTYNQSTPLELPNGTTVSAGQLKPMWQKLEEYLNAKFTDVAVQDQKSNDMMKTAAANNFRDAEIYGGGSIATQLMGYGVDGKFANLTDLMANGKLPHFKAYLEKNRLVKLLSK